MLVVEKLSPELQWIFILASIIAFLLAFSVGANDVSNSFGTSVGSKVLTVTQACILATIFETAGAVLLGYRVCDTFRRDTYIHKFYEGKERELLLGFFSCLIGSSTWNILATAFKMPISGTHSVVGATLGFTLASQGFQSVKWSKILTIVASWFVSPIFSGLISAAIYLLITRTVISELDPLEAGLGTLPLFYGVTVFINVASVVFNGPESLRLDKLEWYESLIISLVLTAVVIWCVAYWMVPNLRKSITSEIKAKNKLLKSLQFRKPPSKSIKSSSYDNANFEPDQSFDSPIQKGEFVVIDTTKKNSAVSPTTDVDLGTATHIEQSGQQQPTKDNLILRPKALKLPVHLRTTTFIESTPEKITKIHIRRGAGTQSILASNSSTLASASSASRSSQQPGSKLATSSLPRKPQDVFDKIGHDMQMMGSKDCLVVDLDKPEPQSSSLPYNFSKTDLTRNDAGQFIRQGERYEIYRLFSSLQIMTACFASFAHGTNDVSNAVAPLVPIWFIYSEGKEDDQETPLWLLLFGAIGICTGLWAWGRSVMTTIGSGLTQLTPTKGFAVELGAATAVLGATMQGLPISTTHCKVGSVVIVGLVASRFCDRGQTGDTSSSSDVKNQEKQLQITTGDKKERETSGVVDWSLFKNIVLAWVITVPFAAAASYLIMLLLKWLLD